MKLHEVLEIDIQTIDDVLRQIVLTDHDLEQPSIITESIIRLIRSGGKRLRPILVMAGARFGSDASRLDPFFQNHVQRIAAILEYLHMASLIHDDIIDRSDLRRNEPTLHTVTNAYTAAHIGNYMMARALEWAAMSNHDEVMRIVGASSVLTQLCIGEYQQLHNQFNFDISMEQYIDKTRNKTALLIANCLKSGAEIAQANSNVCQRLFEFGECLGMIFQIRDDLLDYTHSSDDIGKPVGSDLRNGHVTLPVLFALQNSSLAGQIRGLHVGSSSDEVQRVVEMISKSEAMDRSMEVCSSYVTKAIKIMNLFQDHPAHSTLQILLDYFALTKK